MSVLILATLLKMRPHYGQYSRENATLFRGTSLLAFYIGKYTPRDFYTYS